MTAIAVSAPGKIILFGEHAVVYGRPAIAVPVDQIQAKAVALANPAGSPGDVQIDAPGIGLKTTLGALPPDHPLALPILLVQQAEGISTLPAFRLRITSTIPIASGLGSGAAVSVAIARAVSTFLGRPLPDEQVNQIAYQVDQKYHGTPSGIDNTVITYARPVYFVRGKPFERLKVGQPFWMVIGNSGISTPTGLVVGDLRARWQADPHAYEILFDQVGSIADQARGMIENGLSADLGPLLTQNHALLQKLDVSCPELDHLVEAALSAGALGAKLCGGGRGGNMIALCDEANTGQVAEALRAAGAADTIITCVR
jgi:mevalonate kinase